ncbi:hypothetical protein AB0J37_02005 [Microbispora rosea]|uniref:hypothetical protein n=1 Tax=Microbispora rosea TaxID=58117 RepID=UPI003415B772
MTLYERFVDGEKVERAFTVDGAERQLQLEALAADRTDGWQRAGDEPVKSKTARKRPDSAS